MKQKFGLGALAVTALMTFGITSEVISRDPTPAATLEANVFVALAKKVVPSVVNISTMGRGPGGPSRRGTPDDFFRRFFDDFFRQYGGRGAPPPGGEEEGGEDESPAPRGRPRAMSLGTGFIIDSSGLILTNNHVVADADEIKITFTEEADEKPTDAEVVGRDTELDLALLRVKSKRQMIPMILGDSDTLEVGEYVAAIGNPFGQGHSVTHGIISAKNRDAPDFRLAHYLQTDAPINPGNSGGPLVNLHGEVIGINNAIDARAVGVGFAIPINLVKAVLPQLKEKGSVSRGYIGVLVNELTPEVAEQLSLSKDASGPFVTHVFPGQPADKAGIKPYDVIAEFNGKKIKSGRDLVSAVTAVDVDQTVPIKVQRSGKELALNIKVARRQEESLEPKKSEEKEKDDKPAPVDTGMDLENLSGELRRELGIPADVQGPIVTSLDYGGPADEAGLMRGDVIVEVNQKPVKSVANFYSIVKDKKTYLLRVRRTDPQGQDVYTVVVLNLKP